MSLTRSQVHTYTRKLYRFLRDGHLIEFRKLRVYRGFIHFSASKSTRVELDPRDRVLSTLIHEFLHYQHPDWSESKVLNMERKLINNLSSVQVRNIIKRLAEAI